MKKGKTLFFASLLLLPSILNILIFFSPKVEAASSLTFTDLGTHPQAAAQSTNVGKTISKIEIYNNQLIAGYGDWNANTGPIVINPYDLNTSSFLGSQLSAPVEALYSMKVIDGKLIIPGTDPTCSGTCSAGYVLGLPNGTWQMKTPISAEHVLGVATLTGTDIWLFGSAGGATATAWRSTDDGATWNAVQTHTQVPGGNNTERYYWGAALNGTMYMQSSLIPNDIPVQSFNGTTWDQATINPSKDLCGGNLSIYNPVVFDNKIICINNSEMGTGSGSFGGLKSYSGGTSIQNYPKDFTDESLAKAETQIFKDCNPKDTYVQGQYLYVLCSNVWSGTPTSARVIRTTNLKDWETLSNVPALASSLAVDTTNQNIYVGTTNSKLWKASLPAANTVEPTVYINSPGSSTTPANHWHVQGSATDDQTITRMEVYVDDQLIEEQNGDSLDAYIVPEWEDGTWSIAAGPHTIYVRAYDESGNVGENSINVVAEPSLNIQKYDNIVGRSSTMAKNSDGQIVFLGYQDETEEVAIIGILNPVTNAVSEVPLPDGVSPLQNVFVDHNDDVWFSDCANNRLYKYSIVDEEFTPYDLGSECTDTFNSGMFEDQAGTIWYVPSFSTVISRISSTGVLDEIEIDNGMTVLGLAYDLPTNSVYASMVADDFSDGAITKYSAQDGFVALPTNNPQSGLPLSVDDDGNIWVPNVFAESEISQISPDADVFSFTIPLLGFGTFSGPSYGKDKLWFYTEQGYTEQMSTTDGGEVAIYKLTDGYLSAIKADSDGSAWAIDNINNSILHLGVVSGDVDEPDEDPGDGPGEEPITQKDTDGVDDVVEDAAPNNGDGNGDNIPDSEQANVTSFLNSLTGKYMTVQTSCQNNQNVENGGESIDGKDIAYDYPLGLVGFVGTNCGELGANVDINIFYYGSYDPAKFVLRKWMDNTYSTVSGVVLSNSNIGGQALLKVSYKIKDGGSYDLDGITDGNVRDPVGLGASNLGTPNTGLMR